MVMRDGTIHPLGEVLKKATIETIVRFLESPDWTDAEKAVIRWQFGSIPGMQGDFEKALWGCIKIADDDNLARLERGFPMELHGFFMWTQGDLGQRLRDAGLGI
jgi:hypothetical protein